MMWLLNKLEKYYRRKSYRKNNGILIMWAVYRPDLPQPNVFFSLHPDLKHDDYLKPKFGEIAEHIRKYYSDWEG